MMPAPMLSVSPRAGRIFLQASIVLTLLATTFVSSASAQRDESRPNIEDLLPETTVAFVQIPDIRDLVEKAQTGEAMKFFEEESVAPLYERVVEEGRKAYAENAEEEVGMSLDEIASIPSGEMVIAMVAPRRKDAAFFLIIETGEENEAANKAWGVVKEKASENGVEFEDDELESGIEVEKFTFNGEPAFSVKRDGLIVICTSEKELESFFVRWDGGEVKKVRPLSKNRKFITIMNRCRSKKDVPNDLVLFVDPIKIVESTGRGDLAAQATIAMFPAIGLDSLLGLGGSIILGEEDYEMIVHGHLLLSNPRKGVTKVISLKPSDYEPEIWVPENSYSYTTTSWDWPQMFQELRGIIDLTLDEGTFDSFVNDFIDERIGMSLENDILAELNGRVSVAQVGVEPGKFNSGSMIVGLGLNDVDNATELVRKLMEYFNEEYSAGLEESEFEGFTYWSASDESIQARRDSQRERREERRKRRGDDEEEIADREERRSQRLATMRMPKPSLAIIGSSLVFSDSVEAFEQAVATYKGELEPLRNDEKFLKISEEMTLLLGTDMPVALSYSNPQHQFEQLLDYVNADTTRSFINGQSEDEDDKFFGVLKGVLDDHDLPTMDVLQKYMSPQAWFMTSDDTGYHMLWFQEKLVISDEE